MFGVVCAFGRDPPGSGLMYIEASFRVPKLCYAIENRMESNDCDIMLFYQQKTHETNTVTLLTFSSVCLALVLHLIKPF